MASRIKAIGAYRPRVEHGNTVQKPELIRARSRATDLVTVGQGTRIRKDEKAEGRESSRINPRPV